MSAPANRKKMVGWLAPAQLARTSIEVAISTLFGRHSDHRLVEAMASSDDDQQPFYDYTFYYVDDGKDICKPDREHPRNSIWIDYVGDVGDGWNSTYAVAHYLAEPGGRKFKYNDKETGQEYEVDTRRGEVLIFGGDEVYPTASRQEYEERLVAPYATALRNSPQACPHVFAIPGNHDWYDSLVAFTRLFTARPWFGGWRTRQARSYFALKLPHNWWLLGTDVQLGSDIDKPQMDYFESLTDEMNKQFKATGESARIILCHAEPHWIRSAQYGGEDPNYSESNLKLLERKLGKGVAVFIAGDLHHYRRHESSDKSTQKITAGGGGAFMHATHPGKRGKNLDEIVEIGLWNDKQQKFDERNFKLEGCFPSTKDSSRATWRNLIFPYLKDNESWTFGLVTAGLYLLLTLAFTLRIDDLISHPQIGYISYAAVRSVIDSPLTMLLIGATIGGFMLFLDSHSAYQRIIGGGIHGLLHILAAFLLAAFSIWLVGYISTPDWILRVPWFGGFHFNLDARLLLVWFLILVGGFIVGSFIMGAYLLFSMNVLGRHGNEAFSSLGIEDWKNFVRLHINENGDLTIYPIGIKRVPRSWIPRTRGTGPEFIPDPKDSRATDPELIEPPIVMRAANTKTGVETTSPDMKIESSTQSSRPTAG
jgi:hypothetical protein